MSYSIDTTRRFDKALKKCIKRGLDMSKFKECVRILAETGSLPAKYRPHKLSGKFSRAWECHIEPDWLLVWEQNDTELILLLIDTGSHSDIFG
ncbi:MAG: type II toxin-antitoxin system YafQ family toxin [Muribaculaceae bacterium]|nr:type II toxin-antitoxin system YafQ family toxin [Muribaculaceae bacterium]